MDIFAPWHLLVVLLIVLVLFGPNKLGDLGGALGRSLKDFKKAMDAPESPPPQSSTGSSSGEAKGN